MIVFSFILDLHLTVCIVLVNCQLRFHTLLEACDRSLYLFKEIVLAFLAHFLHFSLNT